MVLLIDGVVLDELPLNTRSLFQAYPRLKDVSSTLVLQSQKVVGPVGLLYVQQREFAVTTPHDKHVSILGSEDATTCIIVVLRHPGSGAVCLAHVNGCGVEEGCANMIKRLQELSLTYPESRLELHLAGGFSDSRGFSEENALNLLAAFHKHPVQISLSMACVGELNTTPREGTQWPNIYGIAVNVKTGDIFPATFHERGPEMALRCTRQLTGSHQMLDIYDCHLGLLRIGPFTYDPLRVDLWLEQEDDFILRHLSTSPDVEPPNFVMQVRATLKHIRDHPFPSVTIFPDNRPHFFRKDESGAWLQCHGP